MSVISDDEDDVVKTVKKAKLPKEEDVIKSLTKTKAKRCMLLDIKDRSNLKILKEIKK